MGKITRYCKLSEEHVGENCFDVCRPSVLGNPYTHIRDRKTKAQIVVKTRELAIEMYKEYFRMMMESEDKAARPFQNEFNRIVDAYMEYPEVWIGCFCKLDEECHGDFIISEVIKEAVKRLLTYSRS